MTKGLSVDLTWCVVDAIIAGVSCRSAAVKWHRLWRQTRSVAPRAQGGDRLSWRIEALGVAIFTVLEATPDITLAEIAARHERENGAAFRRVYGPPVLPAPRLVG
jgi:hypothetical protein